MHTNLENCRVGVINSSNHPTFLLHATTERCVMHLVLLKTPFSHICGTFSPPQLPRANAAGSAKTIYIQNSVIL
jgi:hypothetical protein